MAAETPVLDATAQAAVEEQVRAACDRQDHDAATTLVVERYGPEVLGYLFAVTKSEADTDDAFAIFAEQVWQGLPGFRWQSSLRTWIYCLARSALGRVVRQPHRKPGRGVPLSQAPVAEAVARVRSGTVEYLRTDFRNRVDEVKRTLDPEDQTLLILRVSRNMSWRDIAEIMSDGDELDDAALGRRAAALRKRFERLKESLRKRVKGATPPAT